MRLGFSGIGSNPVSVTVPLEELRNELDRRSNMGYLLTVGDDGRPHCVAVEIEWHEDEIVMGSGRTSLRNARARHGVTLLSPPGPLLPKGKGDTHPGPGTPARGYALIVDCDVTATSEPIDAEGGTVCARPTHAVLHRPAVSTDGGRGGHDCVHLGDRSAPPS